MKKIALICSLLLFLCATFTSCTKQEPCMGCGVQVPDILRFTIIGEVTFANIQDAQNNITLGIQNSSQTTPIPLLISKAALKSQQDSAYTFKVLDTYSVVDGKMPAQVSYSLAYKGKKIGSLLVQYAINHRNIDKVYFNNKELLVVEQCGFLINLSKKDIE